MSNVDFNKKLYGSFSSDKSTFIFSNNESHIPVSLDSSDYFKYLQENNNSAEMFAKIYNKD